MIKSIFSTLLVLLLFASTACASVTQSTRPPISSPISSPVAQNPQEEAATSGDYLDSVESSTVFDLDATISASYSGSGQTWANLIAAPADGANQTDYDFYLGSDGTANTEDPAFTGTPDDAGAYFYLDGGDCFEQQTLAGVIPRDISKTNTQWWIAVAYYLPAGAGGTYMVFENGYQGPDGSGTSGLNFTARPGLNRHDLALENTSGVSSNNQLTAADPDADTNILLVLTYDNATDTARTWHNTTTGTDKAIKVVSGTEDSSDKINLFARYNCGSNFPLGSRVYHVSMGNAYIGDSEAAAIIAHLETRHNRDYTP